MNILQASSPRFEIRTIGCVAVVTMAGSIRLGHGDASIRRALALVRASGKRNVVLDLCRVHRIDDASLGEILSARHQLTANGVVKVVVSGRMRDLVTMTKLCCVFDTYPTLEEALASLAHQAA